MADEPSLPDDIEDLMKAFGVDPAKAPPPEKAEPPAPAAPEEPSAPPPPAAPSKRPAPPGPTPEAQEEVDKMLQDLQAQVGARPAGEKPSFEAFQAPPPASQAATLDMLKDVTVQVRVEVGRTRMYVQDILRLGSGSVVELDRLTGDPLDIFVNDRLVARGEVLVINETFAIRITEVINPAKAKERGR